MTSGGKVKMSVMNVDASQAASLPPSRGGAAALSALAAETLRFNDGGSYTFPDRDQYPHQWTWDSAFAAIGWSHIDPRRAYSELLTLCSAQSAQAMVPHIAYDPRSSAKAYRPEAEVWGTPPAPDGRRTSAITQPPVAATALRYVFERAPEIDATRELVTRLHGWHTFLLSVRDPFERGEPVLVHPWESGRDNAVEWDEPLARIAPVEYGARTDIARVAESQRPSHVEYGRYYSLIQEGRSYGWDQDLLVRGGSFRVLDPGFSAILAAACADLAVVADAVGNYEIARQSSAEAKLVVNSLLRRAEDDGTVWPIDLVTGAKLRVEGAGTALLTLLPDLPPAIVDRLTELVIDGELSSEFGVRSLGRSQQLLEPMRYWRGPVWSNVTWLCALGLGRNGRNDAAATLRARLLHAAGEAGMREYFEPDTGEGLGSRAFSWTAATVLASLSG